MDRYKDIEIEPDCFQTGRNLWKPETDHYKQENEYMKKQVPKIKN